VGSRTDCSRFHHPRAFESRVGLWSSSVAVVEKESRKLGTAVRIGPSQLLDFQAGLAESVQLQPAGWTHRNTRTEIHSTVLRTVPRENGRVARGATLPSGDKRHEKRGNMNCPVPSERPTQPPRAPDNIADGAAPSIAPETLRPSLCCSCRRVIHMPMGRTQVDRRRNPSASKSGNGRLSFLVILPVRLVLHYSTSASPGLVNRWGITHQRRRRAHRRSSS